MTLKVIGAGFGRTGTTSMQAALEELGFGRCYHMTELMKRPSHSYFWEEAIAGNPVDWHKFFQGYQATVDWPTCEFYPQLMEAFPEAKVLLSIRDSERWYDSSFDTIYPIQDSLFLSLARLFFPHLRSMYRVVNGQIWHGTFNSRFADRAYAIELFNRHNEAVKRTVPPERLLVFDVNEGWEPLCHFLGVDVPPDKPFPHLNDKKMLLRAMRWGPILIIGAMVLGLACLGWILQTFFF